MPNEWTTVISASVVPVVVISACGLLCLAFYNRLGSIVSRLRGFQRERLQECESYARLLNDGFGDPATALKHQRILDMLEVQTSRVYRRAKHIRRALMYLLAAIILLALCSLSTGVSVLWPAARFIAEALFVAGMMLAIVGVAFALLELRDALDPVHLESEFVTDLAQEIEDALKSTAAVPGGRQAVHSESAVRPG